MGRSTGESAEMARLKRARAFWGWIGSGGGIVAAACVAWIDAIPFAGLIGSGGGIAAMIGCSLYGWYEIKVVRFRQLLALPD